MQKCRLKIYARDGSREEQHESIYNAVRKGYLSGKHFLVIEPEGMPYMVYWIGSPEDVVTS